MLPMLLITLGGTPEENLVRTFLFQGSTVQTKFKIIERIKGNCVKNNSICQA